MIYKIITLTGKSFTINNPLEAEIKVDRTAPAHYLYLSFALTDNNNIFNAVDEEAVKVYIYDENEKAVMDMLVDEQQVCCSSGGIIFKIYARSMAGLLLDNEAKPQEYTAPSLDMIFKNHAKPFGFTSYKGTNKVFYDSFIIDKGISQWKVLQNFSESFSYMTPKVTFDNLIDFNYKSKSSGIVLSNKYNSLSTVNYESIAYTYKRQELVSEIIMKCEKGGAYDKSITDVNAVKKGIKRQRYLNMVGRLNAENKIKSMLNEASKDALNITVVCSGGVIAEPLDYVSLDDSLIGKLDNLKIGSLHYKLNASGEKTKLTLYREDD